MANTTPALLVEASAAWWRSKTADRLQAVALLLLGAAVLLVIALVPPGQSKLYPPCIFYALTGLYCPGCGSLRCLHSLLHGDFVQAAAYNLLTLAFLPWLITSAFTHVCHQLTGIRVARHYGSSRAIWAIFSIIMLYWIARNLPWHPFRLLAPHVT